MLKVLFTEILGMYVEENAMGLILNQRSSLYKNARIKQLEALAEDGRLEAEAAGVMATDMGEELTISTDEDKPETSEDYELSEEEEDAATTIKQDFDEQANSDSE